MSIADHVTQIYTNIAGFIMRRHMSSIYFVKPSFFKIYFFLAFAFFWLFFAQHLLFISDKADPPPTTGNKIRRCLHIWCSLEFIAIEYLTKREIYNNRSSELSEDDGF